MGMIERGFAESCGGLKVCQFVGWWCSNEPLQAHGVGLWKNIRRGWGKLSSHTRFEVGEGFNVRFWHDLWCGDMTLKDAFPVLFGIVCVRMLLLRRTWSFLVVPISGTLASLE
jgi:hypothetical protein